MFGRHLARDLRRSKQWVSPFYHDLQLLHEKNVCHLSTHIFLASHCGLFVIPRNKDDMGDGVPTDQLLHDHCDCTDSQCRSHIVASSVFVLLVPTAIGTYEVDGPTPSSPWATTMAAESEVCLLVLSQDTSLETVLWTHLLLRTLSHGVRSRRSFWTATTVPTVSSLRAMQVCAQCLILFSRL